MIIGLASLAPQVGKSTIARNLKDKCDFLYAEMSDPVIFIAKKYFGFEDKFNQKDRLLLQDIGILGKDRDPDFWLYHTLGMLRYKDKYQCTYNEFYKIKYRVAVDGIDNFLNGKDVVVSGIRSPGEADEILKMGGKVFIVRRPSVEKDSVASHRVEGELLDYSDFSDEIMNDGTVENLLVLSEKLIAPKGEILNG